MKPYQDHDPVADKGKAEPHPKRPTQHTYRGNSSLRGMSLIRDDYRKIKVHKEAKAAKQKKAMPSMLEVLSVCMRALGFHGAHRGR